MSMFGEYDPYEQLQDCIAQTNENTRMIRKLVDAHNKLDGMFLELTAQHKNVTNLLLQTQKELVLLKEQFNETK